MAKTVSSNTYRADKIDQNIKVLASRDPEMDTEHVSWPVAFEAKYMKVVL
jgi:hypothetical protein